MAKPLLKKIFAPLPMPVSVFGIYFKNPVGLAAGFDKNAKYLQELSALGFGFIEVGTVTPLPQAGNDKPRLFRLPADMAIINRMGFNNDGANVVAQRLKDFRASQSELIIGGNIGKNKVTPNEEAWLDYEKCFRMLYDYVDYFVVNVSSPNTPGLRDLQQKGSLHKILTHLQAIRKEKDIKRPILLKIAPDLNDADLKDICELALDIRLDGLVVNNTTLSRENCITDNTTIGKIGAGGLSGKPLNNRSNELLQRVHAFCAGQMPIIGSGGIMDGKDAQSRINAGAKLIQVYTGFIYSGPSIVKKIVRYLQSH